jgi:hypothetical protein
MHRRRGIPSRRPDLATILQIGGLACLLQATPVVAEVPLVRLAEQFAGEIERTAAGRSVEVLQTEDRTGRGATTALDLADLLVTRLEGRVSVRDRGPRLSIAPTLSEDARRLTLSARVVELPAGRLVDLLSVSVEKDPTRLPGSSIPSPPTRGRFEIVSANRTAAFPDPILDLAFIDEAHLLVVFPESVVLLRRQGGDVEIVARLDLPGPCLPVRAPGGIVVPADEAGAFWVLTSNASRAVRVSLEGGTLTQTDSSDSLPLEGSSGGLRYRVGTALLEGLGPGLGPGPHLAFDGPLAVSARGELLHTAPRPPGDAASIRSGPALATLWPGVAAAASADPPGSRDTIQLVALDRVPPVVVETIPVEGAVRALGSRQLVANERALLAVGVELDGRHHLAFLTLARIQLDVPSPEAAR